MGCSINAYMLVAVPWEEIVTSKRETRTVTKYDPDTGQPYAKKEVGAQDFVAGGPVDDVYAHLSSAGIKDHPKLGVVGHFDLDDHKLIGVMLEDHDVESTTSVGKYSLEALAEQVEKVKQSLKGKLGADVQPRIFFISYTAV